MKNKVRPLPIKGKLNPGDLFKRIENNSSLFFLDEIGIIISEYKTNMWKYSYIALINNRIQQIVVSKHAGYKIELIQDV
tara:strand:+ start:84 stop:320 length:237 start_codon:yes stop_codon:yes gene_type:complete